MFLQQVGRREYLYLQQLSDRGFTVIDVSKPAKPRIVTHVPRENLTLVASGLAIAEAPASPAAGSSGANQNTEGTRGGGNAQQIRVLDVSDPAHPRTVQSFTGVMSILSDDPRGLIYVANGEGIWILSHQQVLLSAWP